MLGAIFPEYTSRNAGNVSLVHAVLAAQLLGSGELALNTLSYVNHLRFSKLACTDRLSLRLPVLSHLVFHIIFLTARKKMIPVAADWIIAFMADSPFLGINSPMKKKGKSVRLNLQARIAAKLKLPITIGVWHFQPWPAFVRTTYANLRIKLGDFFSCKIKREKIYDRLHILTISYLTIWLSVTRPDAGTSRAHLIDGSYNTTQNGEKPYKIRGFVA